MTLDEQAHGTDPADAQALAVLADRLAEASCWEREHLLGILLLGFTSG